MDLSAAGDLLNHAFVLAKEMGKGGGGSTEEPAVCMVLLPLGLGLAFAAWQSRRQSRGGTPGQDSVTA